MNARIRARRSEPGDADRSPLGPGWLVAVLVVALATVAATAIIRYRLPAGSIDAKQQEIIDKQPEIILLGNSLLDEGIDALAFAEIVGQPTLKWASGGSASAYWFLALKNVIAPCEHAPRWAIVFFSDTLLTEPAFRVTGNYRDLIERIALPEEPLLDQWAYGSASSSWARAAERLWPLYGGRHLFRHYAETLVKRASAWVAGVDESRLAEATRDAFRPDNLDPRRFTALQVAADALDVSGFTERVDQSLLPHMIDALAETGIRLAFVRMPLSRDALGQPQPAELSSYVAELAEYLASRGVPLIDLSIGTPLTHEQFADGDHLDRMTGRPAFTQLTAEALRRELGL